jgi:predicted unusual protein kinase regulating ubiquinone biosynthesis (AarF/ABC1/UbiB family)
MEWMDGVSIGHANEEGWDQEDRDEVCTRFDSLRSHPSDTIVVLTSLRPPQIASMLLRLCLHELFTFNAMQTDPNPSNFLWNAERRELQLVDFGGTRRYSRAFVDLWLRYCRTGPQN